MEFINGSGFDTSTIRRLNQNGTEEEKKKFIHERRKDAIYGGVALTGLVGSLLAYDAAKNHGHLFSNVSPTPIERVGGHQDVSHNTQPGHGSLHTKNGDFQVIQK